MEAERMAGLSNQQQIQASHPNPKPEQDYCKINAYTHKPSKEQILTLVIFVVQFSIHCVFIIRPIFGIDHPILYFIWAFYLICIVVVGVDYFLLTCGDPVDRLVRNPSLVNEWRVKQFNFALNIMPLKLQNPRMASRKIKNPFEIKQCKACNKKVKIASYHCWTCKRCVQGMDHHCKYLNNCIGTKNYASFFRLLSFASLYMCLGMAIGIWVFVRGNLQQRINDLTFTKWMALVFVLLNLIAVLVVQILLWFHCYISCFLGMTTVEYIYRDTDSNNEESSNESAQNMNDIK